MRLLKKARQRIQEFLLAVKRPDRALIANVLPSKKPTLAQVQHIDLFLDTWEKNVIGAMGFVALISLLGFFWSLKILNTVQGPAEGGVFQEVLVGSPRHINPIFAVTDTDRTLSNIIFLPLCDTYKRDIPSLAESCEFSGEKTVTVTLGDRRWHDGAPVVADDVIFSLQTMQKEAVGSPWRALANKISITKISDKQVVLSARQPIPELTTITSIGILPKHLWEKIEPARMMSDELNLKPIGSGAFAYKTSIADRDGFVENIDLEAFSDFKPRRAYIDELDFRIAPDDTSAYDLFRMRQVEALFVHDPAQTEDLVKRDVHRYEITPPIVVSLFFNPSHTPIFKKKEVRQAFAFALNRSAIVKDALKGNGVPTRAPFPLTMLKEPQISQPETDIAQATELIKKNKAAAATYTLGVPALPTYQAIAENIRLQLEPLGITIKPTIIGSGTQTGALLSYDLLLLGQDYALSGNPFPYWHSSASGETGTNYARYQIKEVDLWLELLQADARAENRSSLLNKLNQRLITDSPAVYLFQPTYQYYISNKVRGVSTPSTIDGSERFARVANWYTETARVHK
ncbi:MAG: bac 5 protein [Patescibacteria group bacterium]|nr:bac 5 protein [Patescibacteria group bacterium]